MGVNLSLELQNARTMMNLSLQRSSLRYGALRLNKCYSSLRCVVAESFAPTDRRGSCCRPD